MIITGGRTLRKGSTCGVTRGRARLSCPAGAPTQDIRIKAEGMQEHLTSSAVMKTVLFLGLSLLVALAVPGAAKVFDRCELARYLKGKGLDGFLGLKVAEWVCLAKHESDYRTDAVHDDGSSRDYGIFQINSMYWCDDGKTPGSKNACKISCYKLLDDNIDDDIQCAKMIAEEAKGLTPWVAWKKYCQGNVDSYVKGCF